MKRSDIINEIVSALNESDTALAQAVLAAIKRMKGEL